jgi:hypothetical protein
MKRGESAHDAAGRPADPVDPVDNVTLLASTGTDRVDTIVRTAIAHFESTFPQRVHSCYVIGSYAERAGVPTSDVDLTIIFKGAFVSAEERAQAPTVAKDCAASSAIELDVEVEEEAQVRQGASPMLKLASLHVYGADLRASVPLLPLGIWTRDRMHSSYWRIVRLFARPMPVRYPLAYPDPSAEFLGYDRRTIRLPDGSEVPSTRDLIRSVGWAATALIAWKAGRYVARKSDVHQIYGAAVGQDWAPLLEDIHRLCRERWHYRIPDAPSERAQLRAICERTLGFENAFLAQYREYLLAELHGADDAGQRQALWVLSRLPLTDMAMRQAVQSLAARASPEIRQSARETMGRLEGDDA